jgi:hypothetical protein
VISNIAPHLLPEKAISLKTTSYSPYVKPSTSRGFLGPHVYQYNQQYLSSTASPETIVMEPSFDLHAFVSSMNGIGDLSIADSPMLESAYRTSLDPYFSNLALGKIMQDGWFDLESHLIDLSCLYYTGISPTLDFKLSVLAYRDHPLPKSLKQAICFHSCFMSTHPALFPSGPPTMRDRIEVAQNYTPDVVNDDFVVESTDNMTLCDTVRAMLIHAVSQYGLGNGRVSTQILGILCSCSKSISFFETL